MIWFVARRAGGFALTLVVAAALIFLLLPKDTSLPVWLGSVVTLNFGTAGAQVAAALAVTLPLAMIAMILAGAIGIGLALLAVRRPGSATDRLLTVAIAAGVAAPSVWIGMLLVLLFALTLRWLPTGGFVPWDQNVGAALASLILP